MNTIQEQRASYKDVENKVVTALKNQTYFDIYIRDQFKVSDLQELHHNLNNMAQIVRPSINRIYNDLIKIRSRFKQAGNLSPETDDIIRNIESQCKRIEDGEKAVARKEQK